MKNRFYKDCQDQELLAYLKQGDELAFSEIYLRYKGCLYVHAVKMLGDREKAQDVIQELFTKLWYKRDSLSLTVLLSSYLYTSVRNKIFDYISHEKVVAKYQESLHDFIDKGEFQTDNLIRERELSSIIESEISKLPTKMREVFELSRKSNLSYNQIADELNVSENTVRKHITRAIKRLRVRLDYILILIFPFL